MGSMGIINVYGINLTDEERRRWDKREKTTYLEYEIPASLKKRLSGMIEKELKKHKKKKKK